MTLGVSTRIPPSSPLLRRHRESSSNNLTYSYISARRNSQYVAKRRNQNVTKESRRIILSPRQPPQLINLSSLRGDFNIHLDNPAIISALSFSS